MLAASTMRSMVDCGITIIELLFDQVQEFLALLGVLENTGIVDGLSDGSLLLDATHLDAHVLSLDHHDSAKGIEGLLEAIANLLGQVLLHLQTVGEDVHHARYLAESYDVAIGNIGHVHLAEEGQNVVFAKGIELDVLDHHHLVVILMENGRFEGGNRIHRITPGQFKEGARQTFWSALQSLTLRVFSNGQKALSTGVFQKFYLFFSIHFTLYMLLIDIHFTLDNDGTLCQSCALQLVEIVIRFLACDKITHTASPVRRFEGGIDTKFREDG